MVEGELKVFDEVLNAKRPKDSPLNLGSVKPVTGDTEGGAGHTGLTKLILAMETGIISPTLHYGIPNPNIPGLINGRFKVSIFEGVFTYKMSAVRERASSLEHKDLARIAPV